MPTKTRSYATNDGRAYYRNSGRYNEFTKKAKEKFINGSSSSLKQKSLAQAGNNTGAAISTNKAKNELGL